MGVFSSLLPKSDAAIREDAIRAFAAAEHAAARALSAVTSKSAAAQARAAHLRASCDAAYADVAACHAEEAAVRHQLDQQRAELERVVLAHPDARIDEFVQWCDATHDQLRHALRRFEIKGEIDPKTGARRTWETSNIEAVRMVVKAIVSARDRANALRFQLVPDLAAELASLRASVPSVSQAEAVTELEDAL